ncbi:hypothetical protein ABK905_19890 [Acerihabitans sp. KWT182]|uniref:Uncharacterized protein n=1 Tax=Acerihabitans sp. KWT182 TaxID=3157919 RepID=A0AAU7Q6Q3_9GAMM
MQKIIMDPNTELFAVDRFEQPVFYALSRFNEGYLIIYLTPVEKTTSFKFFRSGVSVCLLKSKNILAKTHSFEQLITSLLADHKEILLKKLYDAGYDKHFLHIAKDFFSFINTLLFLHRRHYRR